MKRSRHSAAAGLFSFVAFAGLLSVVAYTQEVRQAPGLEPYTTTPSIRVEPAGIAATVVSGGSESAALTIFNDGISPLTWTLASLTGTKILATDYVHYPMPALFDALVAHGATIETAPFTPLDSIDVVWVTGATPHVLPEIRTWVENGGRTFVSRNAGASLGNMNDLLAGTDLAYEQRPLTYGVSTDISPQ